MEGTALGLPIIVAMVVDAMETEPNLAETTIGNVVMTVMAIAAELTKGSILLAIVVAVAELAVAMTAHILNNGQVPTKEKAERLKFEIRLHVSQMKSPNLLLLWKLILVMVDVCGEEEIVVVAAVEAIVETLPEDRKCQTLGRETIMAVVIDSTTKHVLEVSIDETIVAERKVATAVTVINAGVRSVANTAITMVASSVNRSKKSEMVVEGIGREIGELKLIFNVVAVEQITVFFSFFFL